MTGEMGDTDQVTGELGGGVAEVSEWRPAQVKQWSKHKNMIKDSEGIKLGSWRSEAGMVKLCL